MRELWALLQAVLQAGALGTFPIRHLFLTHRLLPSVHLYFPDPSVPVHVVLFTQENIVSHFLFGVERVIWQEYPSRDQCVSVGTIWGHIRIKNAYIPRSSYFISRTLH